MDSFSLNVDSSLEVLYSVCLSLLDSVAPLHVKKCKFRSEPWLNYVTRALRITCRKFERKWKKDKLQVTFQMLRESQDNYQNTVQMAKRNYLAEVIKK